LSIDVSFLCDWAKEVSYLCVWATCNLILHFSGTLLGSARATRLLPDCGRNLYKLLVFFFFCFFLLSIRCTKTLNSIRLWSWEQLLIFVRKKRFWKHNSTPPSCVFPTFILNMLIAISVIIDLKLMRVSLTLILECKIAASLLVLFSSLVFSFFPKALRKNSSDLIFSYLSSHHILSYLLFLPQNSLKSQNSPLT